MDQETEMRLVHLDLKGAPPRISYYEQIFPLLKKWGTTGILVEYEDMFPYDGELKELAATNAYSAEDIQVFLQLCASHDFAVIPLVQTFGHFEFVLKHEKFHALREIPAFPMTLCPLNNDSLLLVQKMIDQVVALHPGLRWFHIGADEVFHVGICKRCQKHKLSQGWLNYHMFFDYVKKVLLYIREAHPHLKIIMWDDMFRDLDPILIQESGLGGLVEPMVWFYQRDFQLPTDIWDKYCNIFDSVWTASAFKGATGPCMFLTDASHHLENHRGWIDVMSQQANKFKHLRGICVTGWQRYDHYAILCELLPVGLPSLALCLLTIKHGSFTEDVHREASEDLGFKELIPLDPFQSIGCIPQCAFPGGDIYVMSQFLLFLKQQYKDFMRNERMNGWMTEWHIKHNYTNPAHVQHFLPQARQILEQLVRLQGDLQAALSHVFYSDAVEEWLDVNINRKVTKVTAIMLKAEEQVKLGARVKDCHKSNMD